MLPYEGGYVPRSASSTDLAARGVRTTMRQSSTDVVIGPGGARTNKRAPACNRDLYLSFLCAGDSHTTSTLFSHSPNGIQPDPAESRPIDARNNTEHLASRIPHVAQQSIRA